MSVKHIEELSLDDGWRMGEKSFAKMVACLQMINPTRIIEFRAGASSIRLAQMFPQTPILSIDSNPEFAQQAEEWRQQYVPDAHLTLEVRPLKWQRLGLCWFQGYALGMFPDKVSAVIINGPPGTTFRGREICLYQAMSSLAVGGYILLDDYHRWDEKRMVKNWLAVYPDSLKIETIFHSKRAMIILRKTSDCKPHYMNKTLLTDHVEKWLRRKTGQILRFLRLRR